MTGRNIFILGLLILAISCSGERSIIEAGTQVPQPGRDTAVTGEPWVDYHPQRITVSYADRIDATVLPTTQLSAMDSAAAAMPNAVLRDRPEYTAVSEAITQRYQLTLTNQVYTGRTNVAGFLLPDGADGAGVISRIRTEFSEYIDDVHFSIMGRLDYLPDDPLLGDSTATSGPQWQIPRMNVPAAWDQTLGSPDVLIATLDTGVRITHEELSGTMIDPESEYPEITANVNNHSKVMTDAVGHGTSVASLISAEADNARTMTGVAPGCRHLPIRISNDLGHFTEVHVIEGCYLARELGADIVSLSIHLANDSQDLRSAFQDLVDAGTVVIASAGNDRVTQSQIPAVYPGVLSVAATLYDDERIDLHSWGSNYGPDVDIAAPGAYMTTCSWETDSGAAAYREFGGTSASAPLVAGCAALVWSVFPELTAEEVCQALISTGSPTTGFNSPITRPDLDALLDVYALSSFSPAPLTRIAYATDATVNLNVVGTLSSVQAEQMSTGHSETLTTPPWSYDFDLSGLNFGTEVINFVTDAEYGDAEQSVSFPVDNTTGTFPYSEYFNTATPRVAAADGRWLTAELSAELNAIGYPYASPAALRSAGAGTWQRSVGNGPTGSDCWYFGDSSGESYDDFEQDLLLLPRIDLTGVYDGQLRFKHRYNIEGGDGAAVIVRPESTGTWEVAAHTEYGQAIFNGEQADWVNERVLLTDYAGERVQVGLVFNSDNAGTGENGSEPAGWWIDDITVTGGAPKIGYADFADLELAPYSTVGSVAGVTQVELVITAAVNLDLATFTFDTAPVGTVNPTDVTVTTGLSPFDARFQIPAELPNQLAELRITATNVLGEDGRTEVIPLYIFNKRGDANGDGLVNASDTTWIRNRLWSVPGDAVYRPYLDTDGDGTVTEADASLIGYFWEE